MVSNSLKYMLHAEHKIENLVESSTDGSTDNTEKELQELRRMTEQVTLSAIKVAENWGKDTINKSKEYVEEINL
mgnify:CR=1 FL=1